jgi:hydroxymethylglutaryl-CoA reductase (NADPH)
MDNGRGIHVTASCEMPRQVIQDVLRTTPEQMLRYYPTSKKITDAKGMVGYNVNLANAIAAIFVATGQDLACIHESSSGILHFEAIGDPKNPDGIKISIILPNLVIGTVGGGTHVTKQSEALRMINCLGQGKAYRFAKIIAGFALGLEISTYGAIMSGEFAKAHEKLGRNKPVNWFTKSDITTDLLRNILTHRPNAMDINQIDWFNDHGVDNGIITNITSKISNKPIGFLPIKLGFTKGESVSILIKSKALDSEVIKGLHLISASIDTQLSDLINAHQLSLEFHNSHLKELLVYDHLQRNGFTAMPTFYGQWIQPQRDIYLILQEWIDTNDMDLVNAENNTDVWTEELISKCLSEISKAHVLLRDIDPKPFAYFQPIEALPLYHKLMDILINECANPSQKDTLINIKESLSTLHLESETVVDQKTIIHNDFNPRNVLIRTGGVPCIYDWELAVFDFPQRDILEFLSFVLPADFDDQTFWNHIKRHFKKMQDQHRSIDALSWESYLTASKVALKTFICCRVSFYEVSSIVARYDFSQRILTVSLRMLDCIEQELRKPLNA